MGNQVSKNIITVTANELSLTVETLLRAVFVNQPEASGGGDSFLLGFGAEGPNIPDLIRSAIGEIHSLALEQNATIITCEISGIRPTDDGLRLWGTIECMAETGTVPQEPRIGNITCEQEAPASWRISVNLIDEEPQ